MGPWGYLGLVAAEGMSGFLFLLQLGSAMLSMVHVTIGVIGTMHIEIRGPSLLAQGWLHWTLQPESSTPPFGRTGPALRIDVEELAPMAQA